MFFIRSLKDKYLLIIKENNEMKGDDEMESNETIYKTLKYYERLLFHLDVIVDFAEKAKNSINFGKLYLGKRSLKKDISRRCKKEIVIIHALVFLFQCLIQVVIETVKLVISIVDNRINNTKLLLRKAGDPRAG